MPSAELAMFLFCLDKGHAHPVHALKPSQSKGSGYKKKLTLTSGPINSGSNRSLNVNSENVSTNK